MNRKVVVWEFRNGSRVEGACVVGLEFPEEKKNLRLMGGIVAYSQLR